MVTRKTLIVAAIAVVLTLQFAIPAMQLFADGANRWGWQMYSRAPERPLVIARFSDGIERPIPLRSFVFRTRYELRYNEEFAARLCGADVTSIRIEDQISGEVVEHACSD